MNILSGSPDVSNLGFIFHWGLYSVPGFMKLPRKEGNGAEWYLKRLKESSTFRPVSGSTETKQFHASAFNEQDYFAFADNFTASNWNCDEWMSQCKKWGGTYVILTAKHHDGFCLWPTGTTDRNCGCVGPARDLVREFKESAVKHGLTFGVYYSWMEFDTPVTKQYINNTVVPQIHELMLYEPSIWWFDGNWEVKTKYATRIISELCEKIKLSGAKINDRVPGTKKDCLNELGLASYRNFGDRFIPPKGLSVPWESIVTVGNSWGINKHCNVYKSGRQLFDLYSEVSLKHGNFLINLGPDEKGRLDAREVDSIEEFSKLLRATR